ncbi:MAG: penicillin acylase family protein [Candidatus Latescibacteria bacterium]|nr:penicillin acylase family protein [Candidatus Latescibacterota bacterium]
MLYKIALILLFIHQPAFAEVKIYRDAWGVPHIYAQTPEDVMYGFGYAQAEDRLEALLKNYRLATGTMAEAFGEDYLDLDFQQKIWQHQTLAEKNYTEIAPDIRIYIERFVQGIHDFMQNNPQRVPNWASKPHPQDVVALSHYLTNQVLLQQANSEYTGKPLSYNTGNQWVVSAKHSAEDAVLLCADPFGTFQDTFRPYEAHLHGRTLNAFGFATLGLPVFKMGHNQTLGWSTLPGGADGADVYEITLDSPIANRYKYDQKWRPIHVDSTTIAVKIGDKITYQTRLYQRTHHGPIIHREGKRAYAYHLSLANDIQQIEQSYRLMTAKDQKSFYNALKQNHFPPQRIVYGDVYGNIAYFIAGRIPIRSEFQTWNRPVSGNTSETDWQGFHDQEDLPQIINPDAEWLQDCDASTDRISRGITLTSLLHPAYMSGYSPPNESARSFRSRTLLSSNTRLTASEAISYSQDTYTIHSERWIRALNIAATQDSKFMHTKALKVLNKWNGRADIESTGITLYTEWQSRIRAAGNKIHTSQILAAQPLGKSTAKNLRETFSETVRHFENTYGRINVYWKEIHRLRQGDQSWPLVSGPFGLRAIQSQQKEHTRDGISGPSQTILMCFNGPKNIESHSVLPFGQSDNPKSSHLTDQAHTLFSQGRLKPTQFGISPKRLTLQHTLETP